MSVLIVGSIALDSVKTPFGEVKDVLGGSATYASLAASFFVPVQLVGIVGNDFPRRYNLLFRKHGIDLEGLQRVRNGKTFHWAGEYEYDMNQRRTLSTCVNVFENFKPTLPQHYRHTPFVFLANIDPELQLEVLDQIERPRLVMCDTMKFWIEGKRDALIEVLKRVDVVLVNDAEARELCDTVNLHKAARMLLELGPRHIVIKKGEHGCLMFGRDTFFAAPAFPLELVKDPTGAGDTFAGGFIGWLARLQRPTEIRLRQAIIVGTTLASFAVEDFSVRRLVKLSPDLIQRRCEGLKIASHFRRISV
jgi:sugar/nucleoside kinase (ribokinase family)